MGSPEILALTDADPIVVAVLEQVDIEVQESVFRTFTEMAQRYLAAHILAQGFQEPEGRGALSTEAVGSVSQSWTMPNLNTKSAIGSTQYGLRFLEIRDRVIPPARFIHPSC